MPDFYKYLPQFVDPIAFSIGSLSIRWYALGYVAAFLAAFALLCWRIGKGEAEKAGLGEKDVFSCSFLADIFLVSFWGMLLGGRIGYVLFYDLGYFLRNPMAIISPWDRVSGEFVGIYGMSYHGALLGIALSLYFFLRKKDVDLWRVADFLVPAAAGAYFFGRLGNFMNGELVGRATDSFFGMYFGGDGFLRHPSQLYEAFFEGLFLFSALWIWRNKMVFSGQMLSLYLVGYAAVRFALEFLRSPDAQAGLVLGVLTMGQTLSLCMFLAGAVLYFQRKRKNGIIGKKKS